MKKLVVFDLDGTLAPSKSPIDGEMGVALQSLLGVVKVAVISGGNWPQFQKQIVAQLPEQTHLANLSLLPTTGTKFYTYESDWKVVYEEDFSAGEKAKIMSALKSAIAKENFDIPKTWGETIEDRGSQITYSALGQQAPLAEKEKWDPDFAKRKKLQAVLDAAIPEFSVKLGGSTSVDITKQGIDKGYGIHKLRDVLGIAVHEMIFVGDAIFPGGNDYPAKQAGVVSIEVNGPDETKRVIETIVACLDNGSND